MLFFSGLFTRWIYEINQRILTSFHLACQIRRMSLTFRSVWKSREGHKSLLSSRAKHSVAGIDILQYFRVRDVRSVTGRKLLELCHNIWNSTDVTSPHMTSHLTLVVEGNFYCFVFFLSKSKALALKARRQHAVSILLLCVPVNSKLQKTS